MKTKARYIVTNEAGEEIPAKIGRTLRRKAARRRKDIIKVRTGGGNTIVNETIFQKLTKENQNNVS